MVILSTSRSVTNMSTQSVTITNPSAKDSQLNWETNRAQMTTGVTAMMKKKLSAEPQQQPSSSRTKAKEGAAAAAKRVRKSVSTDDSSVATNESGQSAKKSGTKSTSKLEKLKLHSSTLIANGKLKAMTGSPSKSLQTKVQLGTVNPYITCNLCKGYLTDATTIVECLHSFCHSCIMRHLRLEQYCPSCEMMINKAKPNIKPDATLQAIVYKLVPGLYERELLRRREFYKAHPEEAKLTSPEQRGEDTENLIFSPNEKISLSIEYADLSVTDEEEEEMLKKPKYLQCPASFTVNMLRKFIINKFGIDITQFSVDIMYKVKTIVLSDYYTLMDVAYIYTWKREAPMRFYFRVRTKETTAEELPEVPLRRSPGISTATTTATALPESSVSSPVITEIAIPEKDTSDKKPLIKADKDLDKRPNKVDTVETKFKLVKKVDSVNSDSDSKKLVYTFKSTQGNVKTPSAVTSSKADKKTSRSSIAKQQRSLEKGHSKLKRMIQSLSDERKLSKIKKKELSMSKSSDSSMKCEKLKMKITKNNSGVMVVQNSSDNIAKDTFKMDTEPTFDEKAIEGDESLKKSLFLSSIQLTAKKSPSKTETKPMIAESPKTPATGSLETPEDKLSFGFSSYKFDSKEVKVESPPIRSSTPKPPVKLETAAKSDIKKENKEPMTKECALKKDPESSKAKKSPPQQDPNLSPQNLPRRKFSSYVKIAPKEPLSLEPNVLPLYFGLGTIKPKPQPSKSILRKSALDACSNDSTKSNPTVSLAIITSAPNIITSGALTTMAVPRPTPHLSDVYAFLHSNQKLMNPPPQKQLFKPPLPQHNPNQMHYSQSQFQTMPSPVYLPHTGVGGGSTPIYSPNSPQYSPNFNFPQQQHFKYAKLPSYMTNFALTHAQQQQTIGGQKPLSKNKSLSSQNNNNNNGSSINNNSHKSVNYLRNLPPPPIFCASSAVSVTVTTSTNTTPNNNISGKEAGNSEKSANKRKLGGEIEAILAQVKSAAASRKELTTMTSSSSKDDSPPEKQSKVQSLWDSCNITFPSSLSITITSENGDSDKSGSQNSKLKSPVNNYIEILKIPSGEPANHLGSSESNNNRVPVSEGGPIKNSNFLSPSPIGAHHKPPTPPMSVLGSNTTAAGPKQQQQSSSMSITPAITTNLLQSKCNELLIKKQKSESESGTKRKFTTDSSTVEVTPVKVAKRNTPSPPSAKKASDHHRQTPQIAQLAAKQLPKLNPIERSGSSAKSAVPTSVSPSVNGKAAADNRSADAYQKELMKFVSNLRKISPETTEDAKLKNRLPEQVNSDLKSVGKPIKDEKTKRKSPGKGNKSSSPASGTTTTQAALKPAPPKPSSSPLQHQQQEFTAAIMKMAYDLQSQQQKAAIPQQQFPISNLLANNFMIPNAAAMAAAAATAAILNSQSQPQIAQQQQQLNTLIHQACLMEHFQRMKKAGSDALEQIAQNMQQQQTKAIKPVEKETKINNSQVVLPKDLSQQKGEKPQEEKVDSGKGEEVAVDIKLETETPEKTDKSEKLKATDKPEGKAKSPSIKQTSGIENTSPVEVKSEKTV